MSLTPILLLLALGYGMIPRIEPGPKGDRGERGYPGPPGPPGICDCTNTNNRPPKQVKSNNARPLNGYTNNSPNSYSPNSYSSNGYSPYLPNADAYSPKMGSYSSGGMNSFRDKLQKRRHEKDHEKEERENDIEFHGSDKRKIDDNIEKEQTTEAKADAKFDKSDYEELNKEKNLEQYANQAGHKLAQDKKNLNINKGYKGFEKEETYERTQLNDTSVTSKDFEVDFKIDLNKDFKESIGTEGHSGKYKGKEYDFGNKFSDNQGLFVKNSAKNQKKGARYNEYALKNDNRHNGEYYGDEYEKKGDDDESKEYKAHYSPESSGEYYNLKDNYYRDNGFSRDGDRDRDYDLFDKGGYGSKSGEGHRKYKSSKDTGYIGYGAAFEGKDNFDKKGYYDNAVGIQQSRQDELSRNSAKFRDISNKGFDKQAEYQGDYNTRDNYHQLRNKEDFNQAVKQKSTFDGGLNGLEYDDGGLTPDYELIEKSEVKSKKKEGGFEEYNEFDKLNENEYIAKGKKKAHGKRYDERERYNGASQEFKGKIEYGNDRKRGRDRKREKEFKRGGRFPGYYRRRLVSIGMEEFMELEHKFNRLNIGVFVLFCVVIVQNLVWWYVKK